MQQSPLEEYYTTGRGYGPPTSHILRGQTGWESYYLPIYKCPTDKEKPASTAANRAVAAQQSHTHNAVPRAPILAKHLNIPAAEKNAANTKLAVAVAANTKLATGAAENKPNLTP